MDYDLVIFDCDGTLVDSEYLNNLALIRVLHEQGLTQYTIEHAMEHFVGLRTGFIFKQIEQETGHTFPEGTNHRTVEVTEELSPQYLRGIPGAPELVAAASRQGKICVASNGYRDTVISSLAKTGLKDFFPDDHIFTAVQVKHGKPAPDLFLFAAEKMNADPARCIVIEDSVPGVTAGVAAGMHVLGFTNGHAGHEERLKKAGAHAVFDSLIHIEKRLFA